jgi:hypothetical protein
VPVVEGWFDQFTPLSLQAELICSAWIVRFSFALPA